MVRLLPVVFVLVTSTASPAVSTTWHVTPEQSIQLAIDQANGGDTILLSAGTFRGPGNTNVHFSGKALVVRSESGPASTIIDCGALSRAFVFESGEDSTSVLEGITILNGRHNFFGGAIFCNRASPKITDNVFGGPGAGNQSGLQGGAVYCDSSSAVIRHNTFVQNLAVGSGGAVWCSGGRDPNAGYSSGVVIAYNRFVGNVAVDDGGGAIACDESELTITGNTFTENSTIGNGATAGGGAVDILAGSLPIIVDNWFVSNRASGGNGGAVRIRSSAPIGSPARIEFNHFISNGAASGGAVSCEAISSPSIRNNTFDLNAATHGGGSAIYCEEFSDPPIYNNIFANGKYANAVETVDSSKPEIGCCNFYMNDGGDAPPASYIDGGGYLSAFPEFCDPLAMDYRLRSNSPCAPGNHPGGYACALVGADTVGCVATAIISLDSHPKYILHQNSPNPFNPETAISFDVPDPSTLVSLAVFDVSGRVVSVLFSGPAGARRGKVAWNGTDGGGNPVASGVYFYRLLAGGRSVTRKMVLVR